MDLHAGLVGEVLDVDADLADVVRAELVLVLDPEEDLLGVVAHRDAEVLVPLRTQVVVDHVEYKVNCFISFHLLQELIVYSLFFVFGEILHLDVGLFTLRRISALIYFPNCLEKSRKISKSNGRKIWLCSPRR